MQSTVIQAWKKQLTWVITLSLLLSTLFLPTQVQASDDLARDVYVSLRKAVKYYYKRNHDYTFASFDWELIGLAGAKENLKAYKWQDKSKKTAFDFWAQAIQDEKAQSVGSLAKLSISLMKNGYDPTEFNNMNLLEMIASKQESEGRMGDDQYTIFNHVLAVIALEMYEYEGYDRIKGAQFLLERYDDFDSVDDAAFTLSALTFLGDVDGVEETREAIMNKLKTSQNANGSFSAWGSESQDTTVEALNGLISAGEDVFVAPWNKSVAFVLASQVADGGFKSPFSNGESSAFTTEKALVALAGIHGGNSLYDHLTDSERAALKPYEPVGSIPQDVSVYDGFANLLSGKAVIPQGSSYSLTNQQLVLRVQVAGLAKEERPLAVLVKAMKGDEVVATAIVETTAATAQKVTAGLTLERGDYSVEVNYWYGLTETPEVAKASTRFTVKVK